MKHFVAANAVRRSFTAGRRQIEKKNAEAQTKAAEQCRCGEAKDPKHLVCMQCFIAAPSWAKANTYHRDAEIRRRAARQILQVAWGKFQAKQITQPLNLKPHPEI